jgi:hypothetical protein
MVYGGIQGETTETEKYNLNWGIYSTVEWDGEMQRKGTSVCKCIVVDEYIVRWSDTVGMKGAQCDGGGITF